MQTLKLGTTSARGLVNQWARFTFAGQLWGPFHERAVVDRVVSTAQWPVPYYQRIYKAYPIREQTTSRGMLSLSATDITDASWYYAKIFLNKSLKGRQAVQHVENNLQTKTYLIHQNDVGRMAKAYTSDLALFLNSANRENKQILESVDLI